MRDKSMINNSKISIIVCLNNHISVYGLYVMYGRIIMYTKFHISTLLLLSVVSKHYENRCSLNVLNNLQ